MNLVNYEVKTPNGTIFHTTSYNKAKEGENRIVRTYVTPVDEVSPEQRERMRARMLRNKEILKAKRG